MTMKKYQIIWAKNKDKAHEIVGAAGSKAPKDVAIIAQQCGYINRFIICPETSSKLLNVLLRFFLLIRELYKCERNALILLQYPCFSEKIFQYAKIFFPSRRLVTVIHDINSIRQTGNISKAEISSLSVFQEIIVHTPEMKNYLSKFLFGNIKFHILECFPYLTNSQCKKSNSTNEICFAGNIDKSVFLQEYIQTIKKIKLRLYGKMERKLFLNQNVMYSGMFNPDDISTLSGSWGLVWDGNSIESCSGTWGDYLKIIAPHKFSLYLVAGIPVIVWDQSAMAKLVKKYRIGICISNLNELENKILSVSVDFYHELVNNVLAFRDKIKNGNALMGIFNDELHG